MRRWLHRCKSIFALGNLVERIPLPRESPIYPPPQFLRHFLMALLCLVFALHSAHAQQGTYQGTTDYSVGGGYVSYDTYFYTSNCGPGGYFNQTTYTNFNFHLNGATYPLGGQQVVSQGYVSVSCPTYVEPSSFTLSLPDTNNTPYPAGECSYTFSQGISTSSCPTLVTNTVDPYFKVVSILYAPPGNQSTEGLTQTLTDGASTTIGQNFTFGEEFTFSDGIPGVISGGASFGFATSSSNSSAFTQTWSNSQGMVDLTSEDDPLGTDCLNNPPGTPCKNYSDTEDHELDNFYVWLNPELTLTTTTDNVPVSYTTGYQSISGVSQPQPDIIPVKAIQMEPIPGSITSANPTGTSSVPVGLLIPQGVSINGTNTSYYEPGLAILCKHLIQSEYNAGTCTQQDQCGCTPADFAQILVQDPLLRFNPTTLTDNPLSSDVSPLTLDASGESTCAGSPNSQGLLQVDPGSDCRFVVVPSSSTDPTPLQFTLSSTSSTQLAQAQYDVQTLSYGNSQSYNVGIFYQTPGIIGSEKSQYTWTWQDTETNSSSSGNGNSVNLLLQTNSTDCTAKVVVFEDTLYHTFAFQTPEGYSECN